jgi:hypothetical protein
MQTGYIKTNYIKHISPKLLYPYELQECGEISILQIKSYDNLADLFTKCLPLATFDKCVKGIRIPYFLISTKKIYYLQELSYMISSTVEGRMLQIHSNIQV